MPFQIHDTVPIYHYTTGDRFAAIINTGEIRQARGGVEPPEIPAVWLSTASEWEASASKAVIVNGKRRTMTLDEMIRSCDCLVRIRIDPSKVEIIPPADAPSALQIPHWTFARLITSGLAMGADPSDWRASIRAIPVSAFISAEFAFETHPIHWLYGRVLTRPTASGLAVLVQT
jgi:hypothetical protein